MNDIHKRGGTIIGTSRGGHDKPKIVDSIQDRGINQVSFQLFPSVSELSFSVWLFDQSKFMVRGGWRGGW